MEYLPNESLLSNSDSNTIMLTTHRIRYQDSKSLKSIVLDEVSGTEVKYISQPVFLLLALIAGVGGFFLINETDEIYMISSFTIAIMFVLMYLASRKHVIIISSSGTKIIFQTHNMSKETVKNFVSQLEGQVIKLKKL
ncbi:hypothetical protein GCM10011506_36030 [Marivirga lumbricoides]|uniref:QacE n=1 Tax=Marivirga lumbricoides TaxID=1046115 RepID=A0ABQ1MW53_9BACT|nr:hypothetical protein GCM10011506_36030 [Marivirga lumbricoides]